MRHPRHISSQRRRPRTAGAHATRTGIAFRSFTPPLPSRSHSRSVSHPRFAAPRGGRGRSPAPPSSVPPARLADPGSCADRGQLPPAASRAPLPSPTSRVLPPPRTTSALASRRYAQRPRASAGSTRSATTTRNCEASELVASWPELSPERIFSHSAELSQHLNLADSPSLSTDSSRCLSSTAASAFLLSIRPRVRPTQ